jgi:hypothetical protein
MKRFRILAQSFTTSQRIAKTVDAPDADAALRGIWAELEDAGFYPLSVEEV